MKKIGLLFAFVSIVAFVVIAYAQGPGMTEPEQGWNFCPYCGSYVGPRGGYGMHQGMMGGGYGMGPGMMGGQGMMGGYGMMGPGKYDYSEECQKFLDDTVKERKELYNKRYEYSEAFRDPKTSPEDIAKLEKEIRGLQEEIYKKAQKVPQGCW